MDEPAPPSPWKAPPEPPRQGRPQWPPPNEWILSVSLGMIAGAGVVLLIGALAVMAS